MDDGLYGLRFIPKENGVHYLDIKLNDHHIPDSPFAIMVGSMAADPAMVLAHGDGLERGSCGIKPIKALQLFLAKCDKHVAAEEGEHSAPTENNFHIYLLWIKHTDQLPSPLFVWHLKINDATCLFDNYHLILLSLLTWIFFYIFCFWFFVPGIKNKFVVRTAGAGSSFLAVFIEGPSKCALSCREVDEGYEFSYTPFAPGKYLITVKYGNINIAGSPYQSEVTGTYVKYLNKANALSLW